MDDTIIASMKKGQIIPLVIVGALIGAGLHYFKSKADAADQILRDLPRASYEACLESNAILARFDIDEEPRDCESEYLQ